MAGPELTVLARVHDVPQSLYGSAFPRQPPELGFTRLERSVMKLPTDASLANSVEYHPCDALYVLCIA
ncbi:hypothetical protein EVAR_30681_1 [Eumeta japonica]|uniref:Uncharacterized protein n=1 Tax=Eumeta variegata TaxID=151549 RepID=A0A4C1VRC9_EUMVA|nr:hypothetical protein EVAR_30681_1 [Eumeta japonica]